MFKKVFISYAKEDIRFAEELYNYLSSEGLDPWLDKEKLLTGQDWEFFIKKELKSSDFIILLLSSKSVSKRGYVQKEYRLAKEYSEKKLESDIYILPVLLDDCTIPYELDKFQWDKYDENSMEEILKSINYQRKIYIDSLSPNEIELNNFFDESMDIKFPKPFHKTYYNCSYPIFPENNIFNTEIINSSIRSEVFKIISDYKHALTFHYDNPNKEHFDINVSANVDLINKENLSILIVSSEYSGGAYPNTYFKGLNFDLRDMNYIYLDDLVPNFDLESLIKEYAEDELKDSLIRIVRQDYFHLEDIEFTFNEKYLYLYLGNIVPRVMLAGSIIEIPLSSKLVRI